MSIWEIVFFPSSGSRYSPEDYIYSLNSKQELVQIQHRLNSLSELEIAQWPGLWIKPIRGLYQLKAGDHRLYFGIDKRKLVVCHACRKVAQKALQADLERAKINFNNYKVTR